MANKIELITKYSEDAFDEVYRADSRISLVDGNTKDMVFTGAKTVKIPKWNSGGMHDYARANGEVSGAFSQGTHVGTGYGYQQSDMGYEWETFTLSVDRAVQYRVDMFDDEETAKTLVARGSTQVNKQVLVPEIDAYAFAKIASKAGRSASGSIGDGAGLTAPIAALNEGLLWFEENEVPSEDQIIFCSPRFMQAIRNTAANGIVKPLLQGEFSKDVRFTIEEYEGRPIVPVPPRRFMTNVVLGPGFYRAAVAADVGVVPARGEYAITGASAAIDFMIVAKSAIYHIVKYNKIKVFGPDVVQDYDGYKINVHVYHDVFVPDNKRLAVYVHTGGFEAPAESISLEVKNTGRKVDSFTVLPGSVMTNGFLYCSTSAVSVGGAANSEQIITVGADNQLTAASDNYLYVADTAGKVLAVTVITLD